MELLFDVTPERVRKEEVGINRMHTYMHAHAHAHTHTSACEGCNNNLGGVQGVLLTHAKTVACACVYVCACARVCVCMWVVFVAFSVF